MYSVLNALLHIKNIISYTFLLVFKIVENLQCVLKYFAVMGLESRIPLEYFGVSGFGTPFLVYGSHIETLESRVPRPDVPSISVMAFRQGSSKKSLLVNDAMVNEDYATDWSSE